MNHIPSNVDLEIENKILKKKQDAKKNKKR